MLTKNRYEAHIQISEKPLVDWIKKKMEEEGLSPTLVFRDAIKKLKENDETEINPKYIERLQSNIEALRIRLEEVSSFVEKEGLSDKFWKETESNIGNPINTQEFTDVTIQTETNKTLVAK
jgi:phosphopantetheine adenylyltransferase